MTGYVWFLNAVVTIDADMMEKMENKVADISGDYQNYVLSCRWDDDLNCVTFFPDGPWEC